MVAATWFARQTSGRNTWNTRFTGTRVANLTSTAQITCVGVGVLNAVGVINGLARYLENVAEGQANVAGVSSVTATGVTNTVARFKTASISVAHGLTATGKHGGKQTVSVTALSNLFIATALGDYPALAQLVGSVRQPVAGVVINRTRSGKPVFRKYYTATRSMFSLIHEGFDADKTLIEDHYADYLLKTFHFNFIPENTLYSVMYLSPPKFTPIEGDTRWRMEVSLIEQ